MFVLIPLGGKGERFKKEGYDQLKPFIKINGKTIIEHVIDNVDSNFIYIPYNPELKDIEPFLRTKYPNKNFKFLKLEGKTRGAAETIKIALDNLNNYDSPVLCLDGDSFYNLDIVKRWNKDNWVFCINSTNPGYSYIKTESNKIVDIKEKEVISHSACSGAYGFKSWKQLKHYCNMIIENNIMDKGEYYISTVIGEMIRSGCVFTHHNTDALVSLGTPKDVLKFYDISILFDLDGTLVDTEDAYVETWKELLVPYGYIVDKDWFIKNVKGKSDSSVFGDLFPNRSWITTNPSYYELSVKKDKIFSAKVSYTTLIPGAIEFVKKCVEFGIPFGIVTNCNRTSAVEILKYYNIYKYIQVLIIGDECIHPKPYPHPYLKGIEELNKKCIVFEDTPTGVQSAKASGVDCVVGVETSIGGNILKSHGADITIKDFNVSIYQILQEFESCKNKNRIEYAHLENECSRILNAKVCIEKTFLKGGYIANIQRIYKKNHPEITYVVKRENESEHAFNKISKDLELYEREYYFYETFSNLVKLKVPHYYGTIYNGGEKKGIILQNLDDRFTFNPRLDKDGVKLIVDRVAEMHLQFLDSHLLENNELHCATDPLFNPRWKIFCQERWPVFEKKWTGILTEKQIEIGKTIIDRYEQIQENLSKPPLTLLHGDLKIPNIALRDDGELYFLDWQYITKGKGIQDIAFFLIESFDLKDHQYILEHYKSKIDFDIHDLKDSFCYFPFYVAMWFGTTDDSDLIDVNFPKRFVPKLFKVLEYYL